MANLPQIKNPLFPIKIPSMDKEVLFRPFLVEEEKVLLMAKQSGENSDIILGLKQIINNCSQDDIVDSLTYFDLEYIFVKLRAKSINNIIEFTYTDHNDGGKEHKLKLDLNDVELSAAEDIEMNVVVTEDPLIGIRLKFPTIDDTASFRRGDLNAEEILDKALAACIEDVYDSEDVFEFKQYTAEQQSEFINSLPIEAFEKIQKFLDEIPVLRHELKYMDSSKKEHTIKLEGLNDFFTWG